MLIRLLALCAIVPIGCSSETDKPGSAPTSQPAEQPKAPDERVVGAATDSADEAVVVPEPSEGARIELSLLGRFRDPAFGAAGLPAVSASGRRVAYGEELLDGGRGNPNFRLVIRDAALDRPVVVKEVLSPAAAWRPEDEAIVRGRIDEANQILSEEPWIPMAVMEATADLAILRRVGEHTLAITADALELRRGSSLALRRPLSRILKTNAGCPGRPILSEAYYGSGRLLVRFQFETDGCWREAETHVFAMVSPASTPPIR